MNRLYQKFGIKKESTTYDICHEIDYRMQINIKWPRVQENHDFDVPITLISYGFGFPVCNCICIININHSSCILRPIREDLQKFKYGYVHPYVMYAVRTRYG